VRFLSLGNLDYQRTFKWLCRLRGARGRWARAVIESYINCSRHTIALCGFTSDSLDVQCIGSTTSRLFGLLSICPIHHFAAGVNVCSAGLKTALFKLLLLFSASMLHGHFSVFRGLHCAPNYRAISLPRHVERRHRQRDMGPPIKLVAARNPWDTSYDTVDCTTGTLTDHPFPHHIPSSTLCNQIQTPVG
jgi:hypothetical protein